FLGRGQGEGRYSLVTAGTPAYNTLVRRGVSSVGRARRSQRRGRGFESLTLHHLTSHAPTERFRAIGAFRGGSTQERPGSACGPGRSVSSASAADLGRDYSMISSICASNAGEIVNPSACAVFRLITAWSLVGCSTGRSAGLAPLMILST